MKRFVLFVVVLSIIAICPVCYAENIPDVGIIQNIEFNNAADIPVINSILFYQTSRGDLTCVNMPVPKQEGMGKAVLNLLIDSPELREKLRYYDLFPVLPQGTRILGMTIKDGIAKVDFSKEILEYPSSKCEANIFHSIVFTLTEFSTIEKVEILIEGENIKNLKFGFNASIPLGR